ncbi:MAG TPA: nitroreductase family protein [Gemmatimonadaceae bacterium]|nr:nitroreductase family protein [Gemmatimonadaceae bacterium]
MTAPMNSQSDAFGVIYRRRAIRAYKSDVVDEYRVRRLLDAAVHAPTAMDEQPWQFVIIQDRATLRRLSDHAKSMARAAEALHGNVLKPPGANGDGIRSRMADPRFEIFYDAPTLIVICAIPSSEFVTADCWLAAENLMLAACADGLGTCCIGLAVPALNSPEGKAEIGIPAEMRAIAPIILGVPREEATPVPRRAAIIRTWIR